MAGDILINYLADILFITGFSFIILFFYTLFRQKSRLAELFFYHVPGGSSICYRLWLRIAI
jgi:hypothetical protein